MDSDASLSFRPSISTSTKLDRDTFMNRVQQSVESSGNLQGEFKSGHAMISIRESNRHFWSPWMHLDVRDTDTGRQVFARFSPHPSIWTGFMFAYLAIAAIVSFAVMFGISQQLSGESPWAYYFIPGGLVVAVILWLAAQAGQKLAHEQMQQMKSKIENCFEAQNQDA